MSTAENYQTTRFLTLINFDASTLNGTYQLITPAGGFAQAVRIPFMYNSSSSLILFSTDGATDHFFIPPAAAQIFDLQTNNTGYSPGTGYYMLAQRTELYAKTTSGTDRLLIAGMY